MTRKLPYGTDLVHQTMATSRFQSPTPGRPRLGFTLAEVAVAAVILAIIAAITIPQVLDAVNRKRIDDTYDILQELHAGLTNPAGTGFMSVVRTGTGTTPSFTAPGRLSHLSEQILSNNTTNYPNSCGSSYTSTATMSWTIGGPFISRVVSTGTGLRTPIGQIQNTIIRTANPPTVPAWLIIRINDVDVRDAEALDLRVDGVAGSGDGVIRYTAPVAGVVTVDYYIPVFDRC